jgi:hypothetical protein
MEGKYLGQRNLLVPVKTYIEYLFVVSEYLGKGRSGKGQFL